MIQPNSTAAEVDAAVMAAWDEVIAAFDRLIESLSR